MKNLSKLMIPFCIISFSMITSCKKKGCTDSAAINYNAKAEKDDGSCVYNNSSNDSNNDDTNSNFTCRSEEHTSELQSRPHLVCRLLLEKKKKKKKHKNNRIKRNQIIDNHLIARYHTNSLTIYRGKQKEFRRLEATLVCTLSHYC